MLYRGMAGLVLALMVGGLLFAEETRGIITKVGDGSITVRSGGGFRDKKTEVTEKTFKVGTTVHITRAAGKDREAVKLTLDELKTAVKVTSVFVTVTHEGDNVSEIKTGGFGDGFRRKKDN